MLNLLEFFFRLKAHSSKFIFTEKTYDNDRNLSTLRFTVTCGMNLFPNTHVNLTQTRRLALDHWYRTVIELWSKAGWIERKRSQAMEIWLGFFREKQRSKMLWCVWKLISRPVCLWLCKQIKSDKMTQTQNQKESPRQDSNPWPPRYRLGSLTTELGGQGHLLNKSYFKWDYKTFSG